MSVVHARAGAKCLRPGFLPLIMIKVLRVVVAHPLTLGVVIGELIPISKIERIVHVQVDVIVAIITRVARGHSPLPLGRGDTGTVGIVVVEVKKAIVVVVIICWVYGAHATSINWACDLVGTRVSSVGRACGWASCVESCVGQGRIVIVARDKGVAVVRKVSSQWLWRLG